MRFSPSPRSRYFLKKLSWYICTLFVAVTLTFILPRLGPVDPTDAILSKINSAGMTAAEIEALRAEYVRTFRLDQSIWSQYLAFLGDVAGGSLGTSSVNYPKGCFEMVASKLPWSLLLILPTVVLGWLAGNLLGVLAAYRRGLFDKILYPLAQFVGSIPFFCFGLLLVFVFYTQLDWAGDLGAYSQGMEPAFSAAFLLDVAKHYVMPFASIFFVMLGGQAIGMRSLCVYELESDYVKYAETLGLSDARIVAYIFRNAMLPQLAGLALILGTMLGGTLITEVVFSYPGLGTLMLRAIHAGDFPLIQAIALLLSVIALLLNLTVDLLLGIFDPRVRVGEQGDGR